MLRFEHAASLHLAKTISWRVIATLGTFAIAWVISGELIVGLAISGADAAVKTFLYYGHERAWYRWADVKAHKK